MEQSDENFPTLEQSNDNLPKLEQSDENFPKVDQSDENFLNTGLKLEDLILKSNEKLNQAGRSNEQNVTENSKTNQHEGNVVLFFEAIGINQLHLPRMVKHENSNKSNLNFDLSSTIGEDLFLTCNRISILRNGTESVQPCTEVTEPTRRAPAASRSRSRRRASNRRSLRRIQDSQRQEYADTAEREVDEVEYEMITPDTVSRKLAKTWRIIPKCYLTVAETAQQEADLYYSFVNETNPEEIKEAGPNDRMCCICYENTATRLVIPCGHVCLCYGCAKAMALNRSTISSTLITKKCPLCRAAIAKMIRLI